MTATRSTEHPAGATADPPPAAAVLGARPAPAGGATAAGLRLAAVDAGSNAIRMEVADFHGTATAALVAEERLPVRLGHDVFLSGRLTPETMDRAVGGLAEFRRLMDELGVTRYRAVATSAVRESANGDEFLERVRQEAGLLLEPITGMEEARLVYLAVRGRVDLGTGRWAVVDVGGGSVEVLLVDASGVLWSESHRMGAVRLLEELRMAGDEPGRFRRRIEEYTATLRLAGPERWTVDGLIATGGNIETLARLGGAGPDATGVSRLPLATLRSVTAALGRLSFAQRVQELDLREDRADVILPAAVVYERLCELAAADTILVPYVGVREGLLLDLAADVAEHGAHEDARERRALEGAIVLGRHYAFDEAHARHVARLGLSLFEQLRPLHGLDPETRPLLATAAVLHDIGMFVSYKRHHKHSLYLILNSELAGLTARETLLAANLARYHRKNAPSPEHEQFQRLEAPEREVVTRLAAILRVADALDREHRQAVRDVRVELRDDTVKLHVTGSGDLLLERWAVQRKGDLFQRVFSRKLRWQARKERA